MSIYYIKELFRYSSPTQSNSFLLRSSWTSKKNLLDIVDQKEKNIRETQKNF